MTPSRVDRNCQSKTDLKDTLPGQRRKNINNHLKHSTPLLVSRAHETSDETSPLDGQATTGPLEIPLDREDADNKEAHGGPVASNRSASAEGARDAKVEGEEADNCKPTAETLQDDEEPKPNGESCVAKYAEASCSPRKSVRTEKGQRSVAPVLVQRSTGTMPARKGVAKKRNQESEQKRKYQNTVL